MNVLETMEKVLANTFVMYVHAHIAHWNVEGPDFHDKHAFLGSLYDELWSAVDGIAEHIRACGNFAPGTLADLVEDAYVADNDPGRNWEGIRQQLLTENGTVVRSLQEAFEAATEADDQGLVNYLAGRLEIHAKHGWMLRASR